MIFLNTHHKLLSGAANRHNTDKENTHYMSG